MVRNQSLQRLSIVLVRSGQVRVVRPVRPRFAERSRAESDLQGMSDSISQGGTRRACCDSVKGRVWSLRRTSMRPRHGLRRHLKASTQSSRGLVTADTVDLADCWTFASGC